MRTAIRFATRAVATTTFAMALVACSSDDGGGTTKSKESLAPSTPPDDGFQYAADPGSVAVSITGHGAVYSGDTAKTVACVSDGTTTTGTCSAPQQATLYAAPASGSFFVRWDPEGEKSPTLFVNPSTPSKLTAVFGSRSP
jgi:hypothetical protein